MSTPLPLWFYICAFLVAVIVARALARHRARQDQLREEADVLARQRADAAAATLALAEARSLERLERFKRQSRQVQARRAAALRSRQRRMLLRP